MAFADGVECFGQIDRVERGVVDEDGAVEVDIAEVAFGDKAGKSGFVVSQHRLVGKVGIVEFHVAVA